LALVVDILCALLSGGPISKDLIPMYQQIEVRRKVSHFFMALDVSHFCAPAGFGSRMRDLVARVRSLPPLEETVPVMVSGDPEKKKFLERSAAGIPTDEIKFGEFLAVSPRFEDALV
jgi:LDH2 family malate/lactate/ureidoglycolate dehydrogenase